MMKNAQDAIDILYSEVPQVPKWAHALVFTFLENNPPEAMQDLYREKGYDCFGYWASELIRMFTSRISLNAELNAVPYLSYYSSNYVGESVRLAEMTFDDMNDIFHAYCCHMGMHWGIFPYSLREVLIWIRKNDYNK